MPVWYPSDARSGLAGMVGLAPKWVRLTPNGTNPGLTGCNENSERSMTSKSGALNIIITIMSKRSIFNELLVLTRRCVASVKHTKTLRI